MTAPIPQTRPVPSERFSDFGRKFTERTGILELMDDLGRAVTVDPHLRMLGGGNPAQVPGMQALLRERLRELARDGDTVDRLLGNYDPPLGHPRFRRAIAELLSRRFGWEVGPENIAVTNGGQSAFFFLLNLFAGRVTGQRRLRRILFPLAPEYIGYADQGLDRGMFLSCRPRITWPEGRGVPWFRYRIDFPRVEAALRQSDIGAIAVSRPTNPSGNVLTDDEVRRLSRLAARHQVPLIIDNAYGVPFPGVVFVPVAPYWSPPTVLTLSLSKLGLPGVRTGIVVAPPEIIEAVGALTAVVGLANGNLGQQLVLPWVEDGRILDLGASVLRPFYAQRRNKALRWTEESFTRSKVDWALHRHEGAFFQWLWLRRLQIPTLELYQRLKERHVLTVPGEYFFFGLTEDWDHRHECLRINVSQPPEAVRSGLRIIAETAAEASRRRRSPRR